MKLQFMRPIIPQISPISTLRLQQSYDVRGRTHRAATSFCRRQPGTQCAFLALHVPLAVRLIPWSLAHIHQQVVVHFFIHSSNAPPGLSSPLHHPYGPRKKSKQPGCELVGHTRGRQRRNVFCHLLPLSRFSFPRLTLMYQTTRLEFKQANKRIAFCLVNCVLFFMCLFA